MEKTTKPRRRTVGRITVPAEAHERIFGDDPNPEVATPGHWVEVTCRYLPCPEFRRYTAEVAEAVYDVLPPSCPACGHELEAV